jgi:hypothetical protein
MMIPKNREISGTDVLYIVGVDRVGLTARLDRRAPLSLRPKLVVRPQTATFAGVPDSTSTNVVERMIIDGV